MALFADQQVELSTPPRRLTRSVSHEVGIYG